MPVEATPKKLQIYVTEDGRAPFSEWLASLRDLKARAKIRVRLDRVSLGNFGDCHGVGDGVQELRIDYGPGYRVYFGQEGATIVLLLCGGDKSTQTKDIEIAKGYWNEYRRRS
jgi:putative addiction module killer protein